MRKNLINYGVFLLTSFILMSCGGGKSSTSINVDKVNIVGDSKDNIQVVPGTYEIKKIKGTFGDELTISIKLKVTNPFDQSKIDENTAIGNLSLQVLDEKGSPIDLMFSPSEMSDWDKVKSLLKGKSGDEVTVVFKSQGLGDTKTAIAEIMKNGKGIEITRADITNPKTAPIIDNSASSSNSVSEGGDCEQFLSDYEAFADEYVEFMQKYKSNPTDPEMLSDYADMVKKAGEMDANIQDCKSDAGVLSKLLKIQAKIAKAAVK